jgi:hypothetical protein
MLDLKPWMLPLIVAAILVPLSVGFMIGGPPLGLGLGFLAAAATVGFAARQVPRGPIETAHASDLRRHVLIVLTHELDSPAAIDRIVRERELNREGEEADVLILAPAQSGLLDRWATDLGRARDEAQRKLVVSAATLGKANVAADAAVGEEGVVQAVEDRLRSFPASEVILVTGPPGEDAHGDKATAELSERLRQPLLRVVN